MCAVQKQNSIRKLSTVDEQLARTLGGWPHLSIHPSIHPCMHACMHADRQTDRQTDSQADRQTDR